MPRKQTVNPNATKIILNHHLCPGDSVQSVICTESINLQYPLKYAINVTGIYTQEIYRYSPYIAPKFDRSGVRVIKMDHPLINFSNQRGVSWAVAICDYVGKELGITLTPQVARPRFYFSDEEKATRLMDKKYYILNANWKNDSETKFYPKMNDVINLLHEKYPDIQCVITGESFHHHDEKVLTNPFVTSLIGQRNKQCRKTLVDVLHAEFVVTPMSFLHWAGIGCNTPVVCCASGYEPNLWANVQGVRYVGRFGTLPCCANGHGCWKRYWNDCTNMVSDKTPKCMDYPASWVVDQVTNVLMGKNNQTFEEHESL